MTQTTIDATPTWRGILPMLLAILDGGDRLPSPACKFAREELERMADLADAYAASERERKALEAATGTPEPIGKTRVCFRVDGMGEVTAVFPDDRIDRRLPDIYNCYARIGQHTTCCHDWVITSTRPATPEQYASLAAELQGETYGYVLEILPRMPARGGAER